jgi:hypothetical protein
MRALPKRKSKTSNPQSNNAFIPNPLLKSIKQDDTELKKRITDAMLDHDGYLQSI